MAPTTLDLIRRGAAQTAVGKLNRRALRDSLRAASDPPA